MARIRTIKPELFRHKELFDLEAKTGLPIRIAWAGLLTVADREGRFRWQPEVVKLDVLPFDDVDMGAVLGALWRAGFIVKYAEGGKEFGFIPTFSSHQVVNHREAKSRLPDPDSSDCTVIAVQLQVMPRQARGELEKEKEKEGKGKGRELEKEGKGTQSTRRDFATNLGQHAIATYCEAWCARYGSNPTILPKDAKAMKSFAETSGLPRAQSLIRSYLEMNEPWFMTKRHDIQTMIANLNAVTQFADTGETVTRADIRDADNAATNLKTLRAIEEKGI